MTILDKKVIYLACFVSLALMCPPKGLASTLDPLQRPAELQKEINATFNRIAAMGKHWNFNGRDDYQFLYIDAKKFII